MEDERNAAGRVFLAGEGGARPGAAYLSQDLLQQALQEVGEERLEVKEEPGVGTSWVKCEAGEGGGEGDQQQGRAVVLVPTLQPDGSLAYAVQQTTAQLAAVQQKPLVSQAARPLSQKPPILRSPTKPKVILPKMFQQQNQGNLVAAPRPIRAIALNKLGGGPVRQLPPNPVYSLAPPAPQQKAGLLRASAGLAARRLQGGAVEQPITQQELQRLQEIVQRRQQQQQREEGEAGGGQVYRVLYSAQQQQEQEPPSPAWEPADSQETFSVAAFVREMSKSRGRGRQRSRGRPRKGTAKFVNEKKVLSELKREFGLREERAKEFGFFDSIDELPSNDKTEDFKNKQARTRSGRLSRPPKRIIKESPGLNVKPVETEPLALSSAVSSVGMSGAVTNMNLAPPPKVDPPSILPLNKRHFIPPAKYICKVCGKLYLGDKKIARHLKHFPSHEFATPEPPPNPGPAERRQEPSSLESCLEDIQPGDLMEVAGAKLFQSFSMWDLLVKKTSMKGLGTEEALASLFADMQAIVMELKNLVEQCLASERTNEDSFCVTLTPVMSSVLGLSSSGGVTRYVLPYNQIPEHYHKLLGFPTGLRAAGLVSSSTHPNLMSPESTNSIIHPEEEDSQMSLGDKVVLEDNLGARPLQDMDEETQDSAITAPSPSGPSKRRRLDSESQSVTSPPPQTPDFLSQGDDSNLSSTTTTEPILSPETVKPVSAKLASELSTLGGAVGEVGIAGNSVNPGCGDFTDSVITKLPSFSSIISGSPKESHSSEAAVLAGDGVRQEGGAHLHSSHAHPASCQSFQTAAFLSSASGSPERSSVGHFPAPQSAPVSPRVNYTNSPFSRRCSLDNSAPGGLGAGQQGGAPLLHLPPLCLAEARTSSQPVQSPTFQYSAAGPGQQSDPRPAAWSAGKPEQHFSRDYSQEPEKQKELHREILASQTTFRQQKMSIESEFTSINEVNAESYRTAPLISSNVSFEQPVPPNARSSILKMSASRGPAQDQKTMELPGSTTHVTFSEELSHPIPSVSPAKDFREIDLKRQNPTPPSESQSSSIFSDLESVLNEATDFSFHSALAGSDRLQVKTPEKLLASVPPSAIMDNKKPSISFGNFVDFKQKEESKELEATVTCEAPQQEMVVPSVTFSFSHSSASANQ